MELSACHHICFISFVMLHRAGAYVVLSGAFTVDDLGALDDVLGGDVRVSFNGF